MKRDRSPVCPRFLFARIPVKIAVRGCLHEELDQTPLGPGFGDLRYHRGQLCAVVQPGRRCSRLSSLCPAQGQRACRRILSGAQLTGENFRYPWQVHVYQQAIKIGNVLYQLPCNCRCDRALGHTSLRSCYENAHGTECSTCAKEAFFAYSQTKAGQDPGPDPRGHRPSRVREHRSGEAVADGRRNRNWRRMEVCSTSQLARLAPYLPASGRVAIWGRHGFDGIDCGLGGMPGCGHL